MVTKCVYLNIVKWGWKFAVQSICHLLMTSRWLPPPPPPLQAEWLTSYRVCKLKFRNSPQSRGGSAITRRRRSVPARWLCQPACCQRLNKMSLIRKKSVCLSLRTCSMQHFWKDIRYASGCGWACLFCKGVRSLPSQSEVVIAPTKVNHTRWTHLFWLVSSRMVASLPPAINRTKSERLSHAPINGRLNTV